MSGGTAAIREPWRMAAAHLTAAYGPDIPSGLAVVERNAARWDDIVAVGRAGISSPMTSSAGRLFDAVAALVAGRDTVSYEGQAAIELEQLADPTVRTGYPVTGLAGADLVRRVVDDVVAGVDPSVVAARFHNGFAAAAVDAAAAAAEGAGLATVALSGGVFQNLLFLDRVTTGLEARGMTVLVHRRVPPNDGGISLGQAAVAGARDRT
jgi:hydrogenase maturation protein HypF